MKLDKKKILASKALNVGAKRIQFDTNRLDEIKEAKKQGLKKIAMIATNQQGIIAVRDALIKEDPTIFILKDELFNPQEKDFRTAVIKAKNEGADAFIIMLLPGQLTSLVKQIKDRGFKGTNLKLAIADDHQSIKNAVERYFPGLPVQLCIIHKMRNVINKTKFKNRKAVADDIKSIFQSQSKEEAMEKAKATVKKWYMVESKAMESLRFNIEYCFTYMQFPKNIWSKIRTTNILDREFREFRRRMKVFDNTFQNEESANRYTNSIINYLNSYYPLKGGLHTNA